MVTDSTAQQAKYDTGLSYNANTDELTVGSGSLSWTLDGSSSTNFVLRDSAGTAEFTLSNTGTIDLANTTDATLSRPSAGRLAIEGVNILTQTSTDTAITNKTFTSGSVKVGNTTLVQGGTVSITFPTLAGTLYATGNTDVTLADGGTNASLTASNGAVVYSTATAMALTAVGTLGQILRSAGAGAPVWTNGLFEETASTTTSTTLTGGNTYLIVSQPDQASSSRTFTLEIFDAAAVRASVTVDNMCIINYLNQGTTAYLRGTELGNPSGTTAPTGINVSANAVSGGTNVRVVAVSSIPFIIYRIGV